MIHSGFYVLLPCAFVQRGEKHYSIVCHPSEKSDESWTGADQCSEHFRTSAANLEESSQQSILSALMRKFGNLAVWLILWATVSRALWAQGLAGYTRHVWQGFEGLPEQTVQAFAQTPDGYLWIGTTGGLVRFDGAHFVVFDRQNTPALHENDIFCLMVSRDGVLWIGTEGG